MRVFEVIRREGANLTTVRCGCGAIQTVGAKTLARGFCRWCLGVDKIYAGWQAELVAPFNPAKALKVGPRVSA